MPSVWLREFFHAASNSVYPFKVIALFLNKCAGFTFQSESVGAGRSWVSTEKNGTNGSLTNSDYVFTDTVSNSFVSNDRGKYIIIQDYTHNINAGIYLIKQVIDSSHIVIDFLCDSYEFPVAASELNWWITAYNYQQPTTDEYVRLQSPHSTGWAIEIKQVYHSSPGVAWLQFRVSVDGAWGTKIIGNYACYQRPFSGSSGGGFTVMEVDLAGEWLNIVRFQTSEGVDMRIGQMVSVSTVEPFESGLAPENLIALCGAYFSWSYESLNAGRDIIYAINDGTFGCVRVWLPEQFEGFGRFIDLTAGGWNSCFTAYYYREPNRRLGNKYSILKPPPIVLDVNNTNGYYRILGYLKGHRLVQSAIWSKGMQWATSAWNVKNKAFNPLSINGVKDYIHLDNGITIAWPGIGPSIP